MISENMLIINKRIADYALTLCDKMGFLGNIVVKKYILFF